MKNYESMKSKIFLFLEKSIIRIVFFFEEKRIFPFFKMEDWNSGNQR